MENTCTFYAEGPNSEMIERTFRKRQVNLKRLFISGF